MEDYYEDALLMGNTGDDDLVSKELMNQAGNADVLSSETLAELVSSFEKRQIKRAIRLYGNTTEGKRKAAEALGISLSSLYAKLGKK